MALSPEFIDQLRNLSTEQRREALWFLADELGVKDRLESADFLYAIHFDSGNAVSVLKQMLDERNQINLDKFTLSRFSGW